MTRKSNLLIEFDKNLRFMKLYLVDTGEVLGVISEPKLLFDPVEFERLGILELVSENFGFAIVKFDNVLIQLSPLVFPPSLDSLFFAKTVREAGYLKKDMISVLDLGSGTGFLGIYVAANNSGIEHVTFSDISMYAIELSKYNFKLNSLESKGIRGDFIRANCYPKDKEFYDLVLCAPPYIPLPPEEKLLDYGFGFFDTGLASCSIEKLSNHGRELLMVYSNLLEREVKTSVENAGLKMEVLASRTHPFRVPPALKKRSLLDFLRERGLREKEGSYKFWHEVKVARIISD